MLEAPAEARRSECVERPEPNSKKRRYLFEKFAAARRKNPGGNFGAGLGSAVELGDEALQLIFEAGIGGSRVGFSDNLSELLSPFRSAPAVSARF